ncbi:MAG: hypothetical protein H6997_09325 [Moraxellaceae bacterium]|nr:hypothetical protein [Moraxellaceae bacterium]
MFGKIFGKSKKRTFNYNEPDIGIKIIAEYGSNLIASCVIGMSKIGQTEELNEFCGHMAAAALKGDSFGVALSCFMIHKEPFDQYLPLSISSMSDESFEIFVELLRQNMFLGYSKSAKHYLVVNKEEVEEKANGKNPYAQWLMGAWYAFDDLDKIGQDACMKKRMYWYEKSAFEGYLPAIIAIAGLYDNGDDVKSLPVDLKKAAFWYRHGALNGDPMCAYNLGVMYTKGDFVQQNLNVASMWLSYAYDKSNDQLFKSRVQQFAAKYSIKLVTDFNINLDPELNNITSEFQDAYEENCSNYSSELSEWFDCKCNRVQFEPQRLEKWGDLKKLDLRSNRLSELPDAISILTELVDLSVWENNFSTVPKVIFKLKKLTSLNLGVNKLIELPTDIEHLKSLQILDLQYNRLVSLPKEIGKLVNLKQLLLTNNNLTSLPREIGTMTSIEHISIYDNHLSDLPNEIMNLSNLKSLQIQNNNFTDEKVKFWEEKFKNTKCKISFG